MEGERSTLVSFLITYTRIGPTVMTSYALPWSHLDPISKYSHWRSELQHAILGDTSIWSEFT